MTPRARVYVGVFALGAAIVGCSLLTDLGDLRGDGGSTDATLDQRTSDVANDNDAADSACLFPDGGASGAVDTTFAAQFYPNIYNATGLTFGSGGNIYVVGFDSNWSYPTPSALCGLSTAQGAGYAYFVRTGGDGAIDTTFGTAGHVCFSAPGYATGNTVFQAVATEPNDSIVAVGFVLDDCDECKGTKSGTKALVVRITPSGALDPTFNPSGTPPGLLVLDGIPGDRSVAYAVAIDTQFTPPKIVVAGTNATYFGADPTTAWVTRLNHDGTQDVISFGPSPIVDTRAGAYYGVTVIDHDIYVTGANGPTDAGAYVSQFGTVRKIVGLGPSAGSFDSTFAGGNPALVPLGSGNNAIAMAAVPIGATRSIAVGGFKDIATGRATLTAIAGDGGVNAAFGSGGSLPLALNGTGAAVFFDYQFGMLTTDCEARILVSTTLLVDAGLDTFGEDLEETAVARVLATGALDTTFGDGGFALVGSGFNSSAASAAVEDPVTGRIVVALRRRSGGKDAQLGLVRFYR